MKYILILLLFITSWSVQAQGIDFFHGTWAETLAKAKETGKLIFMDSYTSWCGPCKMMSAKTFPDKNVGDFYNPNFVCVKFDMEKGEGPMLSDKFNVDAYPTLLYIDADGNLVSKSVGYQEADRFVETGKNALKRGDKTPVLAKEYESGKRDYNTVYNYMKALNASGKSSVKIANEFINGQKDLTTPENLKFILEAASEVDSRLFDLLIKNKSAIIKVSGVDAVNNRIANAANKTVNKAIEFKSPELLTTAQEKVKSLLPDTYHKFLFESNLKYYSGTSDSEGLLKAVKKLPAEIEKNPELMFKLTSVIEKTFAKDSKLTGACEDCLQKALSGDASAQYQFAYARILSINHKNDKAIKVIDQAIATARAKSLDTAEMELFRQGLFKG